MIPRALSVIDPGRVRGGKPLETPGTEEKETQKRDKTKKESRKCGQWLFGQADKKGGKKWPAAKTPGLNSSFLTLQSRVLYQDKNTTAQRISSARLHKIKELKNEVFDLQRQIEASSLEKQALADLSRRHAKAMGRHSNAKSRLQELLARHRNQMGELRNLLKMSQEAEKNTARELKRVEVELRKTEGELSTLLVLLEDKALAEREELHGRLSVLNEMLEAKDQRIQSLEMQLKLNNSTFSRQLASESRKLLEAGMITKNLLMEIHIIHQKIKEKDRQLYIKNIYANRMPKALRDRSDWMPNDQSLRVDRSVQVDKESFKELQLSQHQETEKNPIQLKKEKNPSDYKGREGKAKEDAQCRKEKQATKKIPMPETSNRTPREFLREMEKETEFLKQELKNLMKTERNPQSDGAKENNQEGDAVEEAEKEEKKPDEQQQKNARSEAAIPNQDPARLKKKYIFSEAIENLHQGLHTSGAKSRAGSLRQASQSCTDTAGARGKIPFGVSEPSFGEIPPPRQDGAAGARGCSHPRLAGRRKELLKELFGEGSLQGDKPWSSSTRGVRAGKGGMQAGTRQIPSSVMGSEWEAPDAPR